MLGSQLSFANEISRVFEVACVLLERVGDFQEHTSDLASLIGVLQMGQNLMVDIVSDKLLHFVGTSCLMQLLQVAKGGNGGRLRSWLGH